MGPPLPRAAHPPRRPGERHGGCRGRRPPHRAGPRPGRGPAARRRGPRMGEPGRLRRPRRLVAHRDAAGSRTSGGSPRSSTAPVPGRRSTGPTRPSPGSTSASCRRLTRWQIRPQPWDRLAANDHDDPVWDGRVLDELASYRRRLGPLCAELTAVLDRFAGLRRPVRRRARGGPRRAGSPGSTGSASTRATPCGSSCTRTSWPRWGSTAARWSEVGTDGEGAGARVLDLARRVRDR